MNNWKNIWNNRKVDYSRYSQIEDLLELDGFQGLNKPSLKQWMNMVKSTTKLLDLNDEFKILEIGCGAGAFLYALHINNPQSMLYGIDYSDPLLNIIKKVIPKGRFFSTEAKDFPKFNFKFDSIVSNSVIQYFPDVNYLELVIKQCFKYLKKEGNLLLIDICDAKFQDESDIKRSENFKTSEHYRNKYENLPHLYIKKSIIEKILRRNNFKEIDYPDISLKGILNTRYRFSICAKKR